MMWPKTMLAILVVMTTLDNVLGQYSCFSSQSPMYDYFPGEGWCPFTETYKEERFSVRDCHPALEDVLAHLREESVPALCLRVVRYLERVPDFGIFNERFMINVNTASGASTTRSGNAYFAVHQVQVDINTILGRGNSLGYYQNFDGFEPGEIKGPWGASVSGFGGYQRDGDMWWFHSKLVSSRAVGEDGGGPDRLPCVLDELVKAELRSHPHEDEAGVLQPGGAGGVLEFLRARVAARNEPPAYIGGRRLREYPAFAPGEAASMGSQKERHADAVFANALRECGTTVAAMVEGKSYNGARRDLARRSVDWEGLFLKKYGWHVTWNFPDGPYFTLWRNLHGALSVGGSFLQSKGINFQGRLNERDQMSLSKQIRIHDVVCQKYGELCALKSYFRILKWRLGQKLGVRGPAAHDHENFRLAEQDPGTLAGIDIPLDACHYPFPESLKKPLRYINESISGSNAGKYNFVADPHRIQSAFEKLQLAVADFQREYDANLPERDEASRFRAQYRDARQFRDAYLVHDVVRGGRANFARANNYREVQQRFEEQSTPLTARVDQHSADGRRPALFRLLQKLQHHFGFASLESYLGTREEALFPEGERYEHLVPRDRRAQRKEEVMKMLDVVFWLLLEDQRLGGEILDGSASVGGMEYVVDIMLVCAYLKEVGAPFMDRA